ncbi:MAG TPA: serine hydrolase [Acetobacteraceae bacterium]|nr:serine hydrolase [Acetobacteraceae bacterium]
MNWHGAAETAAGIAASWTGEGGPGGAILLFDEAGPRAEACGGLAAIETGTAFAADTIVRYASISKHFLASLLLASSATVPDAIGLGDRLGEHLPMLQPALGGVSVGHALDMTGGLPDAMETLWLLGVPLTAAIGRAALLRFVASLDAVNFAPGSELSYSNTGYRLVEAALQAKGVDYAAALRARFFAPLGLGISLAEDWATPVAGLAPGYWRGPRGWERGQYGMHFSASGGLTGSARDLAVWAQALLADRPPTKALLQRLSTPRHMADGRPSGYGLGLASTEPWGRPLVGHGGSLPGYKNHFLLDPDARAGVVVLANREDADAQDIALRVMAALHGATLPEPAAPDALPPGLFAAEAGPFWLRTGGGRASFLGAEETLYPQPDGALASRSATLPMRLRATADGGIAGEIGHAARQFRPVPPDAQIEPGWSGVWVCAAQGARVTVADGALTTGVGPLRETRPLQPIGGGRALIERQSGAWRQVACLSFAGGTLDLATNRSRVLRFRRG